LEIRDALCVGKKEEILLSVTDAKNGKIILELAKGMDDQKSIPYSKNGKYIRRCKK